MMTMTIRNNTTAKVMFQRWNKNELAVTAVAASFGSNSNSKENEATINWRQHAAVFLANPRMTAKGISNRCDNQSIYRQQQWQQ